VQHGQGGSAIVMDGIIFIDADTASARAEPMSARLAVQI
jgi:hypothetical protein